MSQLTIKIVYMLAHLLFSDQVTEVKQTANNVANQILGQQSNVMSQIPYSPNDADNLRNELTYELMASVVGHLSSLCSKQQTLDGLPIDDENALERHSAQMAAGIYSQAVGIRLSSISTAYPDELRESANEAVSVVEAIQNKQLGQDVPQMLRLDDTTLRAVAFVKEAQARGTSLHQLLESAQPAIETSPNHHQAVDSVPSSTKWQDYLHQRETIAAMPQKTNIAM